VVNCSILLREEGGIGDVKHVECRKLIDELSIAFGTTGTHPKIPYRELRYFAERIYLRWMTQSALIAAQGHISRSPEIFEPLESCYIPTNARRQHTNQNSTVREAPDPESLAVNNADTSDDDFEDALYYGEAHQIGDHHDETDWAADEELESADIGEFNEGDMTLYNLVAFMRDALWYLEFNAAVREGDIGRVFKIFNVGLKSRD
jgi:hypothetical protein